MMFRRTTLALALAGLVGFGAAGIARADDSPSDEAATPALPPGRLLILVPHDGNGQVVGRPMVILVPDTDENDDDEDDDTSTTAPDADPTPDAAQGNQMMILVPRRGPDLPWV